MTLDLFTPAKDEPLAAAHARITAYLDEIARTKGGGTYSSEIDAADFELGKAMLAAPEGERAQIAAAALMRHEQMRRDASGGIYSPYEFTTDDYQDVVGRLGGQLLRSKMLFDEALLVRTLSQVAYYAARWCRVYPIKGLLGQIEHYQKKRGSVPAGLAAPLQVMADELARQAAQYKATRPPLAITQLRPRVAALLAACA